MIIRFYIIGTCWFYCQCAFVWRRHEVTSTSAVTFIWAFQKDADAETSKYLLHDDVAQIYSVEVTNPRSGGAEMCKVCPQGASQDGYD